MADAWRFKKHRWIFKTDQVPSFPPRGGAAAGVGVGRLRGGGDSPPFQDYPRFTKILRYFPRSPKITQDLKYGFSKIY